MIKQTIVALILSVGASSVFAAGTVKVFSNGSSEAKTLTGAEYLIDLVGQPRLANSWWPGAVISEELATAAALRHQFATGEGVQASPITAQPDITVFTLISQVTHSPVMAEVL